MKKINQVNETTDYSMFKTLQGNRAVNKLHVKRLIDSFNKNYLLSPIIVNEKFEIIDGQHRFEAAKQCKLPVRFISIKGYGLKEVQVLNENMKNWKKEDYLNAYCDLGYPEYLKFKKFMLDYPDFGIAASIALLTNTTSTGTMKRENKEFRSKTNKYGAYSIRFFQEGQLIIPDYDLSVENAEKILMIKEYYDGYNRITFVRAMIGLFKIKEYNHAKLLERLSKLPTALQHCANITQYKLLIEDIYNYRSRNKVSLRF